MHWGTACQHHWVNGYRCWPPFFWPESGIWGLSCKVEDLHQQSPQIWFLFAWCRCEFLMLTSAHLSGAETPPVLHPSLQLKHFENKKYPAQISIQTKILLKHLYTLYYEEYGTPPSAPSHPRPKPSIFSEVVTNETFMNLKTELDCFFSGIFPYQDSNSLIWWKVSLLYFSF